MCLITGFELAINKPVIDVPVKTCNNDILSYM